MNLFAVSGLMMGVTTTLLALFIVRFGNIKNALQRVLVMLNMALAIWGFGGMMVGLSKTPEGALFWWKIAHVGGIPSVVFVLHIALLATEVKRRMVLLLSYAESALFVILLFSNVLHVRMEYVFNSYYHIFPNDLSYTASIIIFLVIGSYASLVLYKGVRQSTGPKRTQLKYLFFALMIGYWGGSTHFFTVFNRNLFAYGNFLIPAWTLVTTYAILKHHLLDIEVVIKKTLVFAGLLASIFAILILPTLVIQEYLVREAGLGGRLVGLTISGIIIILTMRRIETFLVNVTDKYLFQKKYDYKELLKTFTAEVLTVLELDKLVNLTVDKLSDIIKLKSCAVLLLDDNKEKFTVIASNDIRDPSITLIRSDGIGAFLAKARGYFLKKEFIQKKIFIPESVQRIVDGLNAELIVPMESQDGVTALLSLGGKKSDEEYTQDDLDILLPLARTLAIAISNARLFVELSKTQAEAAQKEKMAVIGTLSAGINHEICNPLGIARGQCEAFLLNLKDGLYKNKTTEELLAKAKEIMAKVIKETDRATSITKKLSGFAKPAKGEAEPVDIAKEIDDVLGLVGYELKLEKIEIEKRLATELPKIFVDRKQFQEVLFNLIRNAGQAIGEKGKISIVAKQNANRVIIDIIDTGSGIPEDKIKELFNPFFTTKDPGKGTGLGLFIVRQVVEKNGGRIYLKGTKVGQGTTFTIEFPPESLSPLSHLKEETKV